MAQLHQHPKIELHVSIILSEVEARALDGLVGYGDDAFIKHFYDKLGRAYMERHEAGLRSFFRSIREFLPPILERTNQARKIFEK